MRSNGRQDRSIDLHEHSERYWRANRPLFWAFASGSALIALIGVGLLVWRGQTFVRDGATSARGLALIFVLALSAGLSYFQATAARARLPGAIEVTLFPGGIDLRYSRFSTDHYDWRCGTRTLHLEDYSRYSDARARELTYFVGGTGLWYRVSSVPKDVYDTILANARADGASIREIRPNIFYARRPRIIYISRAQLSPKFPGDSERFLDV